MSNVQKSQQGILVDMKHSFDMIEGYLYSLLDISKQAYNYANVFIDGSTVDESQNMQLFQFDCFIRTLAHLHTLSKNVQDLLDNHDVSIYDLVEKVQAFNTLFQQFVFPDIMWAGEYWIGFLNTWSIIQEELSIVLLHLSKISSRDVTNIHSIITKPKILLEIPIKTTYGTKKISVINGNLTQSYEKYDIVVCSAYKNGYAPTPKTLIGSLLSDKNISVLMLAKNCELDFKKQGAWLSREINCNFHRIACIELTDYAHRENIELVTLKSVFSTLSYLIEQAAIKGISVKRIALPILGSGHQKLDTGFILSPLMTYCLKMLHSIEETFEIVFYELDEDRAIYTVDRLQELLSNERKDDVFISYSSKQYDIAMRIYTYLTENSIKCWMAPQSIPAGSQYYLEIPKAISSIKILLLLLTQDAVNSRFVPKEVSASLGAGKQIIPFQVGEVILENGFDFLLEGEQIKSIGNVENINTEYILEEVNRKLINNYQKAPTSTWTMRSTNRSPYQ